jgi:hypothetical protein
MALEFRSPCGNAARSIFECTARWAFARQARSVAHSAAHRVTAHVRKKPKTKSMTESHPRNFHQFQPPNGSVDIANLAQAQNS